MVWPDWSGETAVIVGTGPSAAQASLHLAKGRARCIVIKQSWRLAPWADVLYGIDRGWWIENRGGEGFAGLKVSPSPTVCNTFKDVRPVKLKTNQEILLGDVGVVGCGLREGGGHSGFQTINLAIQFGVRVIILVGFDMTLIGGAHWHEDYRGQAKPEAERVGRWRTALDGCAPQFKALGVEVINASMRSVLTAYPKMELDEALSWRASQRGSSRSLAMSS